MIILIAAVSILVAYFVTRPLLTASSDEVKVKTIESISSTVKDPDPTIFNSNALNPAVEVQITPSNQ